MQIADNNQNPKTIIHKIAAIDLYCGAGGLTRGLLDIGIDVLCGIDSDGKCRQTYETNNIRENGSPSEFISMKIEDVQAEFINNIFSESGADRFMLAGCAPCQPFSKQNRHRDSDTRAVLLQEFARLISEVRPDYVFMENVPEIEKAHSRVLSYFIKVLKDNGYNYDFKIINAKDYGVPQSRKRFVLVASRHGKISVPFPLFGKNIPYVSVRDVIGDTAKFPPISAGISTASYIPNHRSGGLSALNEKRLQFTPVDGGDRKNWPDDLILECHRNTSGYSDTYGRMFWDRPAPTITTRFNSITTGRFAHPEQNRPISLKEGAAIQSFPYDYTFYGNMQDIARQIGNAVPPKLAAEINSVFLRFYF